MAKTENTTTISKFFKRDGRDVPTYNEFKSMLSNSYKNYLFDFKFENPWNFKVGGVMSNDDDINEIISYCCKGIPALTYKIDDIAVKSQGRTMITAGYMSYTSPITINFYDVNIGTEDNPFFLSDYFRRVMEWWGEFGGKNISTDLCTRRRYLKNVSRNCEVSVYRGVYFGDDAKGMNKRSDYTNVDGDINDSGENRYTFFKDFFNPKSNGHLTENSAIESMKKGSATNHGIVNIFLFALLQGAKIVDVLGDNDQSFKDPTISEKMHTLGLNALSKIHQAVENRNNFYDVEDVVHTKDYNTNTVNADYENYNPVRYFTTEELQKLALSDTVNVELKNMVRDALKSSEFSGNIENLRHLIGKLGNVSGNSDQVVNSLPQYLKVPFPAINEKSLPDKLPDGMGDIDVNLDELHTKIENGLSGIWERRSGEMVNNSFKFENDSEAQEIRNRLNEILDMLIGKKTLNVKTFSEDLTSASNYLKSGDISLDFIKELVESVRGKIVTSDYYEENKATELEKIYNKKNDIDVLDDMNTDKMEEIDKSLKLKKNVSNDSFDTSQEKELLENAENEKRTAVESINDIFTSQTDAENFIKLLASRTKAESNIAWKKYGDDLIEAIMSEIVQNNITKTDGENLIIAIKKALKSRMIEDMSNGNKLTSMKPEEIGEWYASIERTSTGHRNRFLLSRDLMRDTMLPFELFINILSQKRNLQSAVNNMYVHGGVVNFLNELESESNLTKFMNNFNIDKNHNKQTQLYTQAVNTQMKNLKNVKAPDIIQETYTKPNKNVLTPLKKLRITYAYPSSVNMIDTVSNDSTGDKSLPQFTLSLQFYNIEQVYD